MFKVLKDVKLDSTASIDLFTKLRVDLVPWTPTSSLLVEPSPQRIEVLVEALRSSMHAHRNLSRSIGIESILRIHKLEITSLMARPLLIFPCVLMARSLAQELWHILSHSE
jgi:hypothetical protein